MTNTELDRLMATLMGFDWSNDCEYDLEVDNGEGEMIESGWIRYFPFTIIFHFQYRLTFYGGECDEFVARVGFTDNRQIWFAIAR